ALAPTGPVLVCDIGGGSTELVRGITDVEQSLSVDVGCVRLTERHLTTGAPPTREQVDALVADAEAAVARLLAAVPNAGPERLSCLAGTAPTLTALALGLETYDATKTHLAEVDLATLERTAEWLIGATREEIAARAVVHPGRVDVIAAGALVLR